MSIDVAPDPPAMKPNMRHDDPRFQAEFEQRSRITTTPLNGEVTLTATPDVFAEHSAESNGNGEQREEAPVRRAVLTRASQVSRRIYEAVARKRSSFEPLRNSTHAETDRHAELGTIMRMANEGAAPGTLISIMLSSRYPITKSLAKSLIHETNTRPAEVVADYERPDEDMEAYLDLLEQLGYD
jgi:hypothetical protein